ncbi:MAG: hypothetical protein Q4C61_07150 [Lachnospiraceae bacterium]|nr:hypothetical protein [Lachnospiraceae bacterium]
MIYDYYCVDCGRKFGGEEINFDLAEFLGLSGIGNNSVAEKRNKQADAERSGTSKADSNSVVESRTTQISAERLAELAQYSGEKLVHGKPCRIEITLKELLEIMGENAGGQRMRNLMESYKFDELDRAIDRVFSTNENIRVADQMVQAYKTVMYNKFSYMLHEEDEPKDEDKAREERNLTENYHAYFWVEPEFFDDGRSDKLYTVKYSEEERPVNMRTLQAPTKIRGYCPVCGKAVLHGAGRYRHTLVGLLGAQSAGKTSAIVGLLSEMRQSFRRLGVKYPGNALCDSRYADREANMRLYENGWAVRKTNVQTSAGSFNASLLLEPASGGLPQIVTFIDIAGEQCYNLETQEMNRTALEVYPLINSCHVYLLCTVIDEKGYGNAEGEVQFIPPDAVLQIAKGIYQNLREPKNVPPLCIVTTKADMAAKAVAGSSSDNPFMALKPDRSYLYRGQLDLMKQVYETKNDPDIRGPLKWCCDTYDELKNTTYISMISCSALGRMGKKYEGDIDNIEPYMNENGEKEPFVKQRMDILWKWVLQVIGLTVLDGSNYRVPYIPAYGESYSSGRSGEENSRARHRKLYRSSEALSRIDAVKKLFLNQSVLDKRISDAWNDDLTLIEKLRGITRERKVQNLLDELD